MGKTPGKRPEVVHRGAGRVAFLAHIEAIQTAVDEGWPLTAIYERHKAELAITYSQFARYVARYIKGAANAKPAAPIEKGSVHVPSSSPPASPAGHGWKPTDRTRAVVWPTAIRV
jgi:hypothetical protein